MPHPWRLSRPGWARPRVTRWSCGVPVHCRGVGLDDFQKFPSTSEDSVMKTEVDGGKGFVLSLISSCFPALECITLPVQPIGVGCAVPVLT